MNVLKRIDDSLDLPEEERLILDAVSALCRDRLQPNAAAYDLSGEFPWDNVHAINNSVTDITISFETKNYKIVQ